MAQFQKTYRQDLITEDIKIRQGGTIVFNADNDSNVVSVDLYEDGVAYSGGGTVAGAVICPDGSTVPLTGVLSGNRASVTLTADCFAYPGQIGVGIQVVNGTTKTTVLKAIYNVELFETDNPVDPGSRTALAVGDLIGDIADAVATIPASYTDLLGAIAPTFSTSSAYNKGQYVWYSGKLYRYIADHAAGSWNAGEVNTAKLANDVASAEEIIGAVAVTVPKSYTKNNANVTNISVGRNGKDVSFEILATTNGIGVYSGTLFYAGITYIVTFDIAASVTNQNIKMNTDFGVIEFQGSAHYDFVYTAPSNKSNIFYMNGTANPLCTISVTNFAVYEITGEIPALYPKVLADESTIAANAEAARVLKNCRLIGLNGGYPEFEGNSKEKIIFNWGTASVYVVINGGTQTAYAFSDIAADIPDYAVVDGTKITITMPSIGVFGFDTATNHFVMQSGNFNLSASVRPLYYRYYQVCFGEIVNQKYLPDYRDAINNSLRMVYTTNTARHTIESISGGAIKIHVGGDLNSRLLNWQGLLNWADISSEISNYIVIGTTSGGVTPADITFPGPYRSLVLNTTDRKLHFRDLTSNNYVNTDDIVLLQNIWGEAHGGYLYEEYIDRSLLDVLPDYTPIESAVKNTFNSSYHTGAQDFAGKCQEFSAYLLGTTGQDGSTPAGSVTAPSDFETFLFFTDPHLLEGSAWQNRCYEYMSQIQKYYNSVPVNFCLCGGDWLGNSDLPDEATFKMGYIDGFMHSKFRDCYMLVGNHDTNYQGKKDASSAKYTTRLSDQSIADLWYRKTGRAYYRFDGCHSRFYCFDTGKENQPLGWYGRYGYNQAKWFAESLQTDDSPHIVMAAHIFYNNYDASASTNVIHPLTVKIFEIAQAYNAQGTIEVDGTTYNFAGRTGKVEYFIGGHTHADLNGVMNGIPWVLTTWVRDSRATAATFDLCMADYDNHILHMVRVGGGNSRDISLNA